MPAELTLSLGTLLGFLLVLVRVGGAVTFVPLPGFKSAPQIARAALAAGFTLALASRWPAVDAGSVAPSTLAAWIVMEAAIGVAVGIGVAIVLEAFGLAAQILGLQAGYAYASTIDPTSEADSGVLLVLAQLVGGVLFFAMGLDRQVLRLFAETLDRLPPGTVAFRPGQAQALIALGAGLFSVGFRLAIPVVALLILVDVALALLGRLNTQLQLLSLAFPAKMLTGLAMLSCTAILLPRVVARFAGETWIVLHRVLGI